MGIFSRLTDIINANINAVLEKAEDPEKIIRLMIQEMEDTLVEIRSSAAKCIAERKELERHLQLIEKEQLEWERKAELAMSRDREDLARAALAEKAAYGDRANQVRNDLKLIAEQLDKFNADIGKLQSKLTDAKARQRSLVMRHKSASSQLRTRRHIHDDRLDEMMFRFESAEQRIDRVEGEAESMDLGRKRSLADEIAGLQDDERVSKELDALRERLGKGGKADSKPADNKKADSGKDS